MIETTTAGNSIVDTAASEVNGEARHSALKRLFATDLSMQMEKLYVLDPSSLCQMISSRESRFATFTSHQPRRLVSVWHAADSIIKKQEMGVVKGFWQLDKREGQ